MKLLAKLVTAALLISTFSCLNDHTLPDPGTAVNSQLVDSLLKAPGRYWVIEQITRQSDTETLDYIKYNNGQLSVTIAAISTHLNASFIFSEGGYRQYDAGGVFGPIPYTETGTFHAYSFVYVGGGVAWNAERTRVNVRMLNSLQAIYKLISNDPSSTTEGYLDLTSPPMYSSVEEIKAAKKSERIKIVIDSDVNGQRATYIFTLRAVWPDSSPYGGSRIKVYDKVVY